MPTCSATRRASYTSSSEQQRPDVAPSTASSGRRRWFQSCIVSPITGRPWRTRSAATVELSTPPLIATAMGKATAIGKSGMHGNSAQVRDGSFESACQGVHLFEGVRAAQGKAHAGTGAIARETDGRKHVRRGQGARRTGRAGGDRKAAEIERNDKRLAVDSVEIDIAGIGRAAPSRTVDAGSLDAVEDRALQAVAQVGQALGIGGQVAGREFGGGAECRHARDIL